MSEVVSVYVDAKKIIHCNSLNKVPCSSRFVMNVGEGGVVEMDEKFKSIEVSRSLLIHFPIHK